VASCGHWGAGFSAIYLREPARHLTLIAFANSEALADHHFKVGADVTNDIIAATSSTRSSPRLLERPLVAGNGRSTPVAAIAFNISTMVSPS